MARKGGVQGLLIRAFALAARARGVSTSGALQPRIGAALGRKMRRARGNSARHLNRSAQTDQSVISGTLPMQRTRARSCVPEVSCGSLCPAGIDCGSRAELSLRARWPWAGGARSRCLPRHSTVSWAGQGSPVHHGAIERSAMISTHPAPPGPGWTCPAQVDRLPTDRCRSNRCRANRFRADRFRADWPSRRGPARRQRCAAAAAIAAGGCRSQAG